MIKRILMILTLLTVLIPLAFAQEGTATPQAKIEPNEDIVQDPNMNIIFPPPVYVLHDSVDIIGTINVSDMKNYFLEYRALRSDGNSIDENAWTPATLPNDKSVTTDVIGRWETKFVPDGLYEIRLTVNRNTGVDHVRVSPLRIENRESPFATPVVEATAPAIVTRPPLQQATPTIGVSGPRVTANLNANVRAGDSTAYPIMGSLLAGQSAEVKGISGTGGWYYILAPNGKFGYVSPSTVTFSGSTGNLPIIPPPVTPTPIPTNTPDSIADLHFLQHDISPAVPTCGVAYTTTITVQNKGTAAAGASTILVQDIHQGSGATQGSSTVNIPPLNPGQSTQVSVALTINTFFDEGHENRVTLNSGNSVIESDKSNNISSRVFVLQKGGCG
ncbi:hypothetical protein MASR2M15_27050 [Anaerolineales bacterium]